MLSLTLIVAGRASAQPAALDLTFGDGGIVLAEPFGPYSTTGSYNTFEDVAVQLDGRIVAVGRSANGPASDLVAARFLPDGTPDVAFGVDGRVVLDVAGGADGLQSLVVLADGSVVGAGYATTTTDMDVVLVRFRPDGTLDGSFGTGGIVTTDVAGSRDGAREMAVLPSGQFVVVGSAFVSGSTNGLVARYRPDGTLDGSFGAGGVVATDAGLGTRDEWNDLTLLPDGRLVVVGALNMGTNVAPRFEVSLTRYLANGTLDTAFGTAGRVTTRVLDYGVGYAIRARPDGRLLVAAQAGVSAPGQFAGPFVLVQYLSDGTLDVEFGEDGLVLTAFGTPSDAPRDLVLLPDGRAVAAGYDDTDNVSDVALVRYLADGSLDPEFGTGGVVTTEVAGDNDLAYGLALQPDGRLVAAGYAQVEDGVRSLLVRYGASAESYRVTAIVRDGAGPFSGATVTAAPAGSSAISAVADADGRATLSVPAGTPLVVSVAAAGAVFLPDTLALPALSADQTLTFVRTATPATPAVTIAQQTTIPTSGGTLALLTGGGLDIPSAALSAPLPFIAGTFDAPPPGTTLAGPLVYFGPPGTRFAVPVTLTVPYDEVMLPPGVAEEDLQLVRFDEATGTYTSVELATVDPIANTITAEISSFSGYGAALPGPIPCTTTAPLALSSFTLGDAGAVEVLNGSSFESVDLAGCTALAFSAASETAVDAVSGGVVAPESAVSLSLGMPDGPGAVAVVEGAFGVGDGVGDVLGRVVAAVVYDRDGAVYRSPEGAVGSCGNVPGIAPCNSEEGQAQMAAALAALFGGAVAGEAGPDAALALAVWPNPSAGRTAVSFGLAGPGEARVSVVDALGREVVVLADGPFAAGRHEAVVDASALPAGVYVVRAVTPDGARTARLTVAR